MSNKIVIGKVVKKLKNGLSIFVPELAKELSNNVLLANEGCFFVLDSNCMPDWEVGDIVRLGIAIIADTKMLFAT